ncbi:MAG: hypothetical protein RLZ12_908 [Bacillota bacterium]|jgi:hypothetical protein
MLYRDLKQHGTIEEMVSNKSKRPVVDLGLDSFRLVGIITKYASFLTKRYIVLKL